MTGFGRMRLVLIFGLAVLAAFFLGQYYEPKSRLPQIAMPETYRTSEYRAPTPESIPNGKVIHTQELEQLIRNVDPLLVDVTPKNEEIHFNLPNSLWLSEAGYGDMVQRKISAFARRLRDAVKGDLNRVIVFYCLADCWLSWNAAKRAIALDFKYIYWYPEGTDGWREAGLPLVEAVAPLSFEGNN